MLKIRLVALLFSTIVILSCSGTKKTSELTNVAISSDKNFKFPDDWMGYWKGDLEIFKKNKFDRSLPMALDHAFTDTSEYYKWAIIYGEDTIAGRRDYYLNTIDAEKGHYQTDERNSIFLDSYLYGNKLVAHYEVGSYAIQSSYIREGDHLLFEILVMDVEPVSTTGNQIVEGDTIPEVKSYPIKTMQRAILKKVR